MSNIINFPKRVAIQAPTAQILQFIKSEPDLKYELVEVARGYDVDEFVFRYCEFVNRNGLQEPWPKWEAVEKDVDWKYIRNTLLQN